MNRLRSQLIARRSDQFYGSKTKQAYRQLSAREQTEFVRLADGFFEKGIM